jgi:hypothetical protein
MLLQNYGYVGTHIPSINVPTEKAFEGIKKNRFGNRKLHISKTKINPKLNPRTVIYSLLFSKWIGIG